MMRSPVVRWGLGSLLFVVALGVLRTRPWQPPDRVSCRMLEPGDELQRIADMGVEAGILERRLDIRELVDRRFIPANIKPAEISVAN